MTSDEERIMRELGISCESKLIFHYEGHRYERLSDAIEYARKRSQLTAPEPQAKR